MSCWVDVSLLKRRSLRLFMNAFFSCTKKKVNRKRHNTMPKLCMSVCRRAVERRFIADEKRRPMRAHIRSDHRVSIVQSTKRINTSCLRRHTLVQLRGVSVCSCVRLNSRQHIVAVGRAQISCSCLHNGNGEMETKRERNSVDVCVRAAFLSELKTNTIACAENRIHERIRIHCTTLFSLNRSTTNSSKMISFSSRFAFGFVLPNSAWSWLFVSE